MPTLAECFIAISGEILTSLDLLANRLRSFPELVTSTFQSKNFDWHKTVSYLRQIKTMSLPPTHPLQLHLESRISTWFLLGNAFGCMERPEAQPCTFPRCAGAETSVLGYLICGECLTLTYCSTRCQQAYVMPQFGVPEMTYLFQHSGTGTGFIKRVCTVLCVRPTASHGIDQAGY